MIVLSKRGAWLIIPRNVMNKSEREEYLKHNVLLLDSDTRIKARESQTLEFKETFAMGNFPQYAKTMASFANNRGGFILFGIKDTPRLIVGINKAFIELKQEKFTDALNALFAPAIDWEIGIVDCMDKKIGYLYTEESLEKPIIAQKSESSEKISSGDIYYRYRAQTSKIRYAEIKKTIDEREKKEQERILKLLETIKNSDTTNLGIVNYNNGRFTTPYGVDVTVDHKLVLQILKKAKYIKSGSFIEDGGQPVLRVTGDIELAEEVPVPDVDVDVAYPFIQKQLGEQLGIKKQQLYALIWALKIKGQKKYHIEITTNTTKTQKFSPLVLDFLRGKIEEHSEDPLWLDGLVKEYNESKRKKPSSD